ncbi:hypothetical protein GCM10023168_21540 [Fodinibacter luteus]|uniref:Uncharacterized protein n=1 Tax=Fodinibacter luteus TaxID=552064 RepID=A0ABP8KH28_9MICO
MIEQSLEDADLKGGGNVANHNPRETLACTFADTFTLPEYDPEFDRPAGTVVTGGSVTGYLRERTVEDIWTKSAVRLAESVVTI